MQKLSLLLPTYKASSFFEGFFFVHFFFFKYESNLKCVHFPQVILQKYFWIRD